MKWRTESFERLRKANPAAGGVEPDWDAIRVQVESAGAANAGAAQGARERRGRRGRAGRWLLAAVLVLASAAALVLVLAPSDGSSGFLARAAAALAPTSGTVLYERWETTFGAEVGNPRRGVPVTYGPEQLWIETDHPRRYRTVLAPRSGPFEGGRGGVELAYRYGVNVAYAGSGFDPRTGQFDALAKLQQANRGRALELGGTAEAARASGHPGAVLPTLAFMPPNRLLRARLRVTLGPTLPGPHDQAIEDGTDPVEVLRAAIAEGRAKLAGASNLGGRRVEKISIRLPGQLPADAPPLPSGRRRSRGRSEAEAYVEPQSLRPVEIVFGGQTYRFLDYEYLPATGANLALTDVRERHRRAVVVDTLEPRRRAPDQP